MCASETASVSWSGLPWCDFLPLARFLLAYIKLKFCENNNSISCWHWVLNCLFVMSALSSTHLTMSMYGRILGLAAIQCKNEQASFVIDASEDPCEPAVAITSIILGFSSSSRLYMPSQVVIPVSLLQAVSVYKGIISWSSELGDLPFFPIVSWILLCIVLCSLFLQFTNEVRFMTRKRWWESFKCWRHIKYTTLREMALDKHKTLFH